MNHNLWTIPLILRPRSKIVQTVLTLGGWVGNPKDSNYYLFSFCIVKRFMNYYFFQIVSIFGLVIYNFDENLFHTGQSDKVSIIVIFLLCMTLQILRFATLQNTSFAMMQQFSNGASRKLLQRPFLVKMSVFHHRLYPNK